MSLIYNQNRNVKSDNFDAEKDFLFKIDNTLQSKKMVSIQEDKGYGSHIACTDLSKIFLNFEQIKSLSKGDYENFLRFVKGFNYHELSHILYTKYGRVNDYKIHRSLNLLEDQRIENMFSKKYLKSVDYFRLLSVGYVLKDGFKPDDYLLLYGRRFIIGDVEIMKKLKAICIGKYMKLTVEAAEKIIDEYLVTTDKDHQIFLAKKFYDLFPNVNNKQAPTDGKGNGRKSNSKDDKELSEKVKDDIEKGLSNDNESVVGEKSDSDKELINKLIDKSVKNMKTDIENQMKIMEKQSFGDKSLNISLKIFQPEANHIKVMNDLKMQIRKIRNDLDNKTVYNQKRGRINMRKAISSNIYNTNDFKMFIPEKLSKTKLAVSVLIDSSGSMQDKNYETALSSGWAVATALEDSGSKVKVYEFSTGWKVLKDFDTISKNGKWGRNYSGGTSPGNAYLDAERSLNLVSKKYNINNQVIIIITDGQFKPDDRIIVENKALELKKKGIYTAILYVGQNYILSDGKDLIDHYMDKTKYNKVIPIRNFNSLTNVITQMIKSLQIDIIKRIK